MGLIVTATTAFAGSGKLRNDAAHEPQGSNRVALHGKERSGPQKTARPPTICGLKHLKRCLKHVGEDQAGIWTSPLHLSAPDAIWLAPLAGATGIAINYDAQAQRELGIDKIRIDASDNFSNAVPLS